jgi:hypothetical protein
LVDGGRTFKKKNAYCTSFADIKKKNAYLPPSPISGPEFTPGTLPVVSLERNQGAKKKLRRFKDPPAKAAPHEYQNRVLIFITL